MLAELSKVLRYPRLQKYYALTENLVFEYIVFLRRAAEIVILDPLLITPIRDVNDLISNADGNHRRSGYSLHQ